MTDFTKKSHFESAFLHKHFRHNISNDLKNIKDSRFYLKLQVTTFFGLERL
jgi:hypothetical protein